MSNMKIKKEYRVLFRDVYPDESGTFDNVVWHYKETDSLIKIFLLFIKAFFQNNLMIILLTSALFFLFEVVTVTVWILKYFSHEFFNLHNSHWYLIASFILLFVLPLSLILFQQLGKKTIFK